MGVATVGVVTKWDPETSGLPPSQLANRVEDIESGPRYVLRFGMAKNDSEWDVCAVCY